MRNNFKLKICLLVVAVLILGLATLQIIQIKQLAESRLAQERARLEHSNRVKFEKIRLTPHLTDKVKIIQNTNRVRDLVKFQDSYFAATDGGLVQTAENGEIKRRFSVLDGLPESDLTALAVFENKLFIGTKTSGFLAFDGENFMQFKLLEGKENAVTSFLNDAGNLLIGTFASGLLEFDGEKLREIKADEKRISAITFLAKEGGKMFVGTFDKGFFLRENGVWKNFTTAENLPSNRVVGAIKNGANFLIATDFGISEFDEKILQIRFVLPTLSSIAKFNGQVFLAKENGAVFVLEGNLPKPIFSAENLSDAHLTIENNQLFLLSSNGIFIFNAGKFKPSYRQDFGLNDNFISALAIADDGGIWAGNFRRGIDILTAEGKRVKYLEDEKIREINYLQTINGEMTAATSSGFFRFKKDFSSNSPAKKEGLPSNSIAHFTDGEIPVIATNKGLTLIENGKLKTLSTVQGLPSNSVTSVLAIGKILYAGTLNGLVQIQENKIVRTFNETNSKLSPNWVTALIATDERIFIGTYGGSVFELTASGELRSFENETGKFSVNPNAMFADSAKLFVGTLNGLQMLDLQTQSWRKIEKVLPSEIVLSITADAENYWFATPNGIARIQKSYFQNEQNEESK